MTKVHKTSFFKICVDKFTNSEKYVSLSISIIIVFRQIQFTNSEIIQQVY